MFHPTAEGQKERIYLVLFLKDTQYRYFLCCRDLSLSSCRCYVLYYQLLAAEITFLFIDGTLPKIEASSTSVEHITNLSPVSVQIGTRVTVLSGVSLEITCTASGIPEPSIFWLRQGKQIDFSERFSVHNGTLVVRAIHRSDKGSFTCTANNTIGKTATSTQVDVLGKSFKINLLVSLTTARHSHPRTLETKDTVV